MRKFYVVFFVMAALLLLAVPSPAQVAVGISIRVGTPPPVIPVYTQPLCPGPGYFWTPGYWAYGPAGYYWVPGTWVMAPTPGLLWTPGYWGWGDGVYLWHAGYWGPHVGFYGGINYGFGYFGGGFVGGHWDHGAFFYNTAVWHVNTTVIHNTYIDRTVIRNVTVNRVSYNGGHGGIEARPTPDEQRWAQERHVEPTHDQMQHERTAQDDRSLRYSENHGRPAMAASARPGEFAHGNSSHAFTPPQHNEAGRSNEHQQRAFNPPAQHNNGANRGNNNNHEQPSHANGANRGNNNHEQPSHANGANRGNNNHEQPSHANGGNANAHSAGHGQEARPKNASHEEKKPEPR